MTHVTEIETNIPGMADLIRELYSHIPYPDLKLKVEIECEDQELFHSFLDYHKTRDYTGLGITTLDFELKKAAKHKLTDDKFKKFMKGILFDLIEQGYL